MKKRMFFAIVGLAVLFGGIFGYKWFVAYKTQEFFANQQAPAVTVSAAEAATDTWQPSVQAVGSLQAVRGVDIAAEVAGKVVEIAVADGAQVDQGQTLVRLDAAADRAELRGLEAEAQLARIELERQRRLRGQNVNSQADVDTAESRLQQTIARVEAQQALLDKKVIEAPFGGRLGIIEVDAGQFLDVGRSIVTLQTLDPIYVDFSVPQRELERVVEGLDVVARVDTFAGRPFAGRITAVSPKLDAATRSASVRARLDNPGGRLRPGMFVDVAVQLPEQREVITLPQTAVTYNPYGDSVFLVHETETDDGETELTVERKLIRTGATRGDQVAIVQGVEVGDRVVTSGQLKLRNGSRVTINNEVAPSNDAAPEIGNR